MTSSVGLFIEALSNLYIVVTYLCIKGWWSLVNKVVHTVYYLADCTHIGYGRLAHSFLSEEEVEDPETRSFSLKTTCLDMITLLFGESNL